MATIPTATIIRPCRTTSLKIPIRMVQVRLIFSPILSAHPRMPSTHLLLTASNSLPSHRLPTRTFLSSARRPRSPSSWHAPPPTPVTPSHVSSRSTRGHGPTRPQCSPSSRYDGHASERPLRHASVPSQPRPSPAVSLLAEPAALPGSSPSWRILTASSPSSAARLQQRAASAPWFAAHGAAHASSAASPRWCASSSTSQRRRCTRQRHLRVACQAPCLASIHQPQITQAIGQDESQGEEGERRCCLRFRCHGQKRQHRNHRLQAWCCQG